MPVNYVATGPISFANLYGRRGAGGDGGGAGQVVQLHDDTARLQNQLALAGLQGQIEGDQTRARGDIQSGLQRQAAELDAWQFRQKVTEQEAMQDRQDQNAIAAISADPTMSATEKIQAKTRIKSRIDWVAERQKRDLQQAQVQMYQAHAHDFEAQAELARKKRVWDARSMDGQGKIVVDDKDKPDLAQYMTDAFPMLRPGTPEYQAQFEKRAAETGVGRKYVTDPKTGGMIADPYALEQLKHGLSAAGGGGGVGGAGAGPGAPRGAGKGVATEESAGQGSHDYWSAVEQAAKAAGPGADADKIVALTNKLLEGHAAHMGKYAAGTPEGRRAESARADEAQAFGIGQDAARVAAMPVPPEVKAAAGQILSKLQALVRRYPEHSRPPEIRKQIVSLSQQWDGIQSSPAWQAALKGVGVQGAAGGGQNPGQQAQAGESRPGVTTVQAIPPAPLGGDTSTPAPGPRSFAGQQLDRAGYQDLKKHARGQVEAWKAALGGEWEESKDYFRKLFE